MGPCAVGELLFLFYDFCVENACRASWIKWARGEERGTLLQ